MQELETLVGGWADGLVRWRRSHHAAPEPGTPCANCATPLMGQWCHACGQLAETFHRSIGALVVEAIESFFHFDGRLWRTVPKLTFHPGTLTRDYLDGHRAPQIPPLRLFLVVLLLTFFVGHCSSAQRKHAEAKPERGTNTLTVNQTTVGKDGRRVTTPMTIPIETGAEARAAAAHAGDEAARAGQRGRREHGWSGQAPTVNLDGEPGQSRLERWLQSGIVGVREDPKRFGLLLEIWGHRVAVLALPISALLLSLLYVFQRRFYVFDHLIFSMHSLSFQLLLLSTIFLLSMVIGGWAWWLVVAAPIHLYKHLRGVYGSGRFGTVARMGVLFIGTVICFSLLAGLWLVLGLNDMIAEH